jgi:hypothetical protein
VREDQNMIYPLVFQSRQHDHTLPERAISGWIEIALATKADEGVFNQATTHHHNEPQIHNFNHLS